MKFEPSFVDKVRESTDIVEIIGQFTQLKPNGSNFTGLCPFPEHREKSPSFSVSSTKQVYYCFGCKKAGDVFTFVSHMQGLSFPEAIEYLARKAGIEIPQQARFQEHHDSKKGLHQICEFAAQVFKNCRQKTPAAHPLHAYLKGRGFSDEVQERFLIGYAPASWDFLTRALESKKVDLAQAASLGLVKARTKGQKGYFDIFRDRLIFPIYSTSGQAIGFGGRSLNNEPPKYLNSPESPVFHKGKVFYGLHETAKFIRAQDKAIVVEGYTDFLSLYQAGVQNVVATLGTALTVDHAHLLKRFTKNVVVLFDGDAAGQAAAERSAPILLAQGLYPRGLVLPEGQDPDQFVRAHGGDEMRARLDAAPELFSLIVQRHLKGFQGSQSERVALLDQLMPLLHATSDSRLRDLYTAELAEWLRLEKRWVIDVVRKGKPVTEGGAKADPKTPETRAPVPETDHEMIVVNNKPPRAEVWLLNLALLNRDYLDEILQSDVVSQFGDESLQKIFRRMEHTYRQLPSEFDKLAGFLTSQVKPASILSLHMDKSFAEVSREGAKKLISDCIRRITEVRLRAQQQQIAAHLRGQQPHDQLDQLEQIMNIQRHRQALKNDPEPQ